jgi:hypothetical protein
MGHLDDSDEEVLETELQSRGCGGRAVEDAGVQAFSFLGTPVGRAVEDAGVVGMEVVTSDRNRVVGPGLSGVHGDDDTESDSDGADAAQDPPHTAQQGKRGVCDQTRNSKKKKPVPPAVKQRRVGVACGHSKAQASIGSTVRPPHPPRCEAMPALLRAYPMRYTHVCGVVYLVALLGQLIHALHPRVL